MNDDVAVATPSQTVGPFFHFALTANPIGRIADRFEGGEPIKLLFRVTDADGQVVTDAIVELWQTDGASSVFGRLPTGEDGTCEFETVRPTNDTGGSDVLQAPHVNVCLLARGLLRQLHTRVYFAGDPALAQDPVLALVPDDRRSTLLAHPDSERPGTWVFDVRLQGARETVFFDV